MRFYFILFLIISAVNWVGAQTTAMPADTSQVADTVKQPLTPFIPFDTAAAHRAVFVADSNYLVAHSNKPVVNDVEQIVLIERNAMVFIILTLLAIVLTYVKISFSKELDELFQSILNQNMSQQIFRTQRGEFSFTSMLLNLNFVMTISLYVRFVLLNYFHVHALEKISTTLFLIFLFTLFYLLKIVMVKAIGVVFELKDECDEYVFNFSNVCKIAGLTLLPALFVLYSVPVGYFHFIVVITCFIFATLIALLLWRGLSTAYKLLYRSVYHFFIYVCVVEISLMFLLFKLLTKTIN